MENQTGFERFLKLLAGRVGQLLNLNAMAGEVGVWQSTLTKWLSVLEASFIVFCYFQKLSGSNQPGWVVYAGDLEWSSEDYRAVHFANAFT